jgi:hypothetical protein
MRRRHARSNVVAVEDATLLSVGVTVPARATRGFIVVRNGDRGPTLFAGVVPHRKVVPWT